MTQVPRVIQEKLEQMAARRPANQARGRRNHAKGENGQMIIRIRLQQLGVLLVEPIHVGWKIIRCHKTSRIIDARPLEKVSGDIRAVLPGGRSVHCEVKKKADRLSWSDFDDHQIKALDAYRAAGALALVGFVWEFDGGGHAVMTWPIPGLAPGKTLSVPQAKMLNLKAIRP